MNFNIKFITKNIYRSVIILIIIANIFILYFLYMFGKPNVIDIIYLDKPEIIAQASLVKTEINLKRYENLKNKINNRLKKKPENIDNIFD